MNRRDLIALTAAFAVSLAAPLPALAEDVPGTAYTPEALQAALDDGQTVFLDFKASWCPTCAAQGRAINALRAENPAYDEAITFMIADWDEWGKSQIVTDMNVPRRSTLIVLKGDRELGRVIAATSESDIKALLDRALEG